MFKSITFFFQFLCSAGEKFKVALQQKFLGFFFALGLVCALTFGSGLVGLSQTDVPTTREELVEQIEAWAVEDAKTGEMSKPELYEKFADNEFDLSKTEIFDIYRSKFNEASEEVDPWAKWLDKIPKPLAGIILFIVGILANRWWSSIEALANKVIDWCYGKVAGNPLFLNWALKKYQKALAEKHENLDTPFKINPPLAMAEVYVPLKVKEVSEQGMIPATAQSERDIYRMMVDYNRLMVTGAPGSGKSVLLKHIVYTYGEKGFLDLPGLPIPVRLELNSLREADLDEAKFLSKLVAALDQNNFPNAQGFIEESLEKGKLLLLLDGLDEVPSDIRDNVVWVINGFLAKYKDCRAIATCRTAVYEREFEQVLDQNHFKVDKFSDRQIRNFLGAWRSRMHKGKSVEQLIQALQTRPNIKTLAKNPLLLTIIAYRFTELSFTLPHSRAKFYEETTKILLEQRDQKKNIPNTYSVNIKQRVLQRLALAAQDRHDPNSPDRRSIPWELVNKEIQQVLPAFNLNSSETNAILEEIIGRSGLLQKFSGGEYYQFAHLSLQEFFAAEALQGQHQGLVERWMKDTGAWREVVKLRCGLAGNSTVLIQEIFRHDVLLAFECLAEAKEVDPTLANDIIATMQGRFEQAITKDVVAQAFGSVAAGDQQRSRDVLRFLSEQLTSTEPVIRTAAANALSMTNLPQAAQILAERYYYAREEVQAALIRLGDIAVKPLVALAKHENNLAALDDLFAIKTPDAAIALASLLWHQNKPVRCQAAWFLVVMLRDSDVESELTAISAAKLAEWQNPSLDSSDKYNWFWSPFGAKKTDPIAILTGRIAAGIVEPDSGTKKDFQDDEIPDLRIIIPYFLIDKNTRSSLLSKLEREKIQTRIAAGVTAEELTQMLFSQAALTKPQWLTMVVLSQKKTVDFLSRIVEFNRLPTKEDWQNLFNFNQGFKLEKSFYWWFVLVVAVIASVIAMTEMAVTFSRFHKYSFNSTWLVSIYSFSLIGVISIPIFWVVLWQGFEYRLEPSTFRDFGVWGVYRFKEVMVNLFAGRHISELAGFLNGITVHMTMFGTVIVTFALSWALTLAGAETEAKTGVDMVTVVATWTLAGARAVVQSALVAWFGIWAGSKAWAGSEAFPRAWAELNGTLPLPMAIAFWVVGIWFMALVLSIPMLVAGAFLTSFGIYALEAAYQSQQQSFGTFANWKKWCCIFAFPYFCWLPITVVFSFLGLQDLVTSFQLGSWGLSLSIWLSLFSLCTVLWCVGQAKDRAARNPLQGILDDDYPQYKQLTR
ncbi:putative signal transduction protein with Nacht domain [[Leptolyngbya] sp. PCC 7376]|uniref:NACHT domain-containing protein n=1 Tax=[Leptolyngbya] sp. PCC 7376 TaxID=111781 RepID=UPI00029F0EAE|nr:NACHT domain-containing protein [[Leptolyngbya] sp. PCC 7376]AFY39301.1 putative signal transduction protein with Nacht domain [[Leptolyngbya] sp. PCC 7376]